MKRERIWAYRKWGPKRLCIKLLFPDFCYLCQLLSFQDLLCSCLIRLVLIPRGRIAKTALELTVVSLALWTAPPLACALFPQEVNLMPKN